MMQIFNTRTLRQVTSICRLGLILGVLSGLLFACSTPQPAPPSKSPAKSPSNSQLPARSGGYYQDDGPGANPPNIEAIADALPRAENLSVRANRPYVVFGQTYQPMTSLTPFKQRGMASWYGRKFHGQKTSVGEVYDMYAMTAAHPTLPLPSYVRVTNVRSGKSVVVRVNDRGPFLQQRVIDLSYTAAAKLGYINAGSTEVDVELITSFGASPQVPIPEPRVNEPKPQTPDQTAVVIPERLRIETVTEAALVQPRLMLQLGAFSSSDAAETAKERMRRQFDEVREDFRVVLEGNLYKVHLGPYPSREAAAVVADKVRAQTEFKPITVNAR